MTAAGTSIHASVVADMVRSDAPGAPGDHQNGWYRKWMIDIEIAGTGYSSPQESGIANVDPYLKVT